MILYDEDIIFSILVHNRLSWNCINGGLNKAYTCYHIHSIDQTLFITYNFGMYNDGFAVVFKGRSHGENTSRIPPVLIIGEMRIKVLRNFRTWKSVVNDLCNWSACIYIAAYLYQRIA